MEAEQEQIMGCCICFENLGETPPEIEAEGYPNGISIAPCAHIFHHGCITKWLIGDPGDLHNNCPHCRNELTPEDLQSVRCSETTCKDQRYLIVKERLKLSKQSYVTCVSQLGRDLSEARRNLEQKDAEISRVKQQLTEARGKLGQQENEITQLNHLLTIVKEANGEVWRKFQDKDVEVNQVKQKLMDITRDLGKARGKLGQNEIQISQLNQQLTAVKGKLKRKVDGLLDLGKDKRLRKNDRIEVEPNLLFTHDLRVNLTKHSSNEALAASAKRKWGVKVPTLL